MNERRITPRIFHWTSHLNWVLCLALIAPLASGCSAANAAAVKTPSASEQLAFGVQMARRGLWDEAHFRFVQAQRLDPNNPKVVNNLAVAAEATGRFDDALELYREALRLSPNDRELRRNFSRFIEFYQGLNPDGEEDGEGSEATADGSDDAVEGGVPTTAGNPEEDSPSQL